MSLSIVDHDISTAILLITGGHVSYIFFLCFFIFIFMFFLVIHFTINIINNNYNIAVKSTYSIFIRYTCRLINLKFVTLVYNLYLYIYADHSHHL